MSSTDQKFTWVQTHNEIAEFLKGNENKQKELIELLKNAGVTIQQDEEDGKKFDLEIIDPFTFFCYIYIYGSERRLRTLQNIARQLNLTIPEDDYGIPSVFAQKTWLFTFKTERKGDEIDKLWNLFYSALDQNITEEQFKDALSIKSVGPTKLTEALFFVDPEHYFPIDKPTKVYLKGQLGIDPTFKTFPKYQDILKQVKQVTGKSFYEVSYEAWLYSEEQMQKEEMPDMNKWAELFNVIRKIDDESAVRKFFRSAAYVFGELGVVSSQDDQKVYASAIKNYIQVTVGGRYVAMVERKKNRTLLGFYAKNESLDRIRRKYPQLNLEKGIGDNDTNRTWVKIAAEKANEEDFFDGILTLAREGYEGQKKSQFRSRYPDKHNPWIIRAALDESVLDNLIAKYYLVGGKWGNIDKTDEFVANGVWVNGHEKKFTGIVNEVPAGSNIAIKAPYTREKTKSVMLIKARGKVNHNPENSRHLEVEWEAGFNPFEVGFSGGYRSTIHEVTKANHIVSIWFNGESRLKSDTVSDSNFDSKRNDMNHPLNTIFYGPPGTGKTYNTIKRAAEIVEGRKIEEYKEAKEIFNEQLGDSIEFITFHQNYSYEDFIEGLRPDTENDKDLRFNRVDGLFKTIADEALINFIASKSPQTKKKDFNMVFQKFISPLVDGEVEEIEVERKRVSYFITNVTERSIEFRKASGTSNHTLSIRTLNKMYNSESLLNIQGLSGYYSPLLDKLLEMGKTPGITETVERKNYVLIIDEINRANISRVFGELITLIEPDKRYGRELHIPAKLPSGEKFSVPENLYIIGTMNTADKSIALLDIALRRRFEFEAMYPKYEIKGEVIHDVDILQKINDRIKKLKGHDFQIGHSYFMKNHMTLKQRMNRKVIPLLLEYFMNDEKEVRDILTYAGLKIKEDTWPLEITERE